MVRSAALLAALALFAAGCGDTETSPSENVSVFTAQLSPANEVPLVTNAESSGRGTVTILLTVERDSAGAITSGTADFQVNMTNFPTSTVLTMSHIHVGAAGVAGGIRVNTGQAPGDVSLATGSASYMKKGVFVSGADAQAIIDNPAGYYFNVHSQTNGPGVARGQLVKTQ